MLKNLMHRQVLLLATAQALFQTISVIVMTVGALAGSQLAPSAQWATLPIATMFLGTAVALFPASFWMDSIGRRIGFMCGATLGVLGGLVAAWGIYTQGKYRQGEKGRAEGLGGKVFQAENSNQRTQILDTVLAIANELGVSAGQVAIAWAGTHGAVPIIGPRSAQQLSDNLAALQVALTAEQISRLDTVSHLERLEPTRTPIQWGQGAAQAVA